MIHVSYSELEAFWQCPTKHRWAYVDRWNIDEGKPALDRGTVWHAMLQTHYEVTRRPDWTATYGAEDLHDKVMATMVSGGLDEEQCELLTWMYAGYVENYGYREPEYDILATEINRTIPLPMPDDPYKPSEFGLKVKIDMVTRNRRTGQLLAWDHKTAGDFTPPERLQWRPQFPLYTWALRAASLDIAGFMVNSARTKRNKGPMNMDQRFQRRFMLYTDTQLTWHALNAAKAAHAIHDPNRIEYSSPRDLNMGACTWCDFAKPHAQIIRGADETQAMTDFGFVRGFR